MAKRKHTLDLVSEALKRDTRGLTIQDLSDSIGVSRITVALALAKLEGADKIDIRQVSAAKLHYWRGK